jgi:hypothetical protein
MKKFWFLLIVLFLTACNSRANEITRLESEFISLKSEIISLESEIISLENEIVRWEDKADHWENMHNVLIGNLEYRDYLIIHLEERLEEQKNTQAAIPPEILESFTNNLNSVTEFLGIDDLYIATEDIVMHGNFVTARSDDKKLELIFQYQISTDDITWDLLSYTFDFVNGPGFLCSGRQSNQDLQFSESFTMRFIRWPESDNESYEEEILPHNWQRQVIDYMRTHLNLRIFDLWYEGSRLVVDLTPAAFVPTEWGSYASAQVMDSLFESLGTMPNVSEIEVLVGGQRRFSSSHSSSEGTVRDNNLNQ